MTESVTAKTTAAPGIRAQEKPPNSATNDRKLPFGLEFDDTPEELQTLWVAIAAAIDDGNAATDPIKRRAAARGALSAAMRMFQERGVPIAPLLCLQWGLDDLDLGRTPPIFEPTKYGRGGQSPKVEELCGLAFLSAALEALFCVSNSKIEARQRLIRDLAKQLPSELSVEKIIPIREDRSSRPVESRQCDTLEGYRKDFEKGRNKSGEFCEWALNTYKLLMVQLGDLRGLNADAMQIELWYKRQLTSSIDAFCRSLISPR